MQHVLKVWTSLNLFRKTMKSHLYDIGLNWKAIDQREDHKEQPTYCYNYR